MDSLEEHSDTAAELLKSPLVPFFFLFPDHGLFSFSYRK